MDHIVVDVEIQKTIEQVGGWNNTDQMGVSCAVVYEFTTDRYRIYGPNDVEALKDRILKADRISGYNIWKFDFPVIWGLPSRERVEDLRSKTDDLLMRIWSALRLDPHSFSSRHAGWGLDVVCKGTLGVGKSGHGADAPKLWQEGNWPRLVEYCMDDVRLERDLCSFLQKYKYVVNGISGQVVPVRDTWQMI